MLQQSFGICAAGFILWMVGLVLSLIGIYPLCYVGIVPGFLLFIAGVIAWVLQYERTYNTWPQPLKAYRKILKKHEGHRRRQMAMQEYALNNMREFFAVAVLILMLMMMLSSIAFRSTDAFAVADRYMQTDETLKKQVGDIEYYSFVMSGGVSSYNRARLRFSVFGSKGSAKVKCSLKDGKGELPVSMTLRT